jgi:multisubunit Na+/H+ antiporter MnhG subunit
MSIVKIIVLAVIVGAFVLFAGRIGLRRLSRPAAGAPHLRRPVA